MAPKPKVLPARETELPPPEDQTHDNLGGSHADRSGEARDDSSSNGNPSDEA